MSDLSSAGNTSTRYLLLGGKVLSRIGYFFLLLVLANLIMYSMINLAPGSPMESAYASPHEWSAMEEAVGLDRPFFARFFTWLSRAMAFDFGFSYKVQLGVPVIDMIGASFLRTVALIFLAVGIGFTMAAMTAAFLSTNNRIGTMIRPLVLLFSAVPVFLMCYWIIRGLNLGVVKMMEGGLIGRPLWFPLPSISGSVVPFILAGFALAIGDGMLADQARVLRTSLQSLGRKRYLHAAKARGASPLKHGLRAFSIEAVGLMTSRLVSLLGAAVIVEKLFSIEGIGFLLWEAALQRDYSVVVGIAFLSTLVVIAAQLFSDLYQLAMDPRVRTK